jgi:hypothetical protein
LQICELSALESMRWEKLGIVPDCRTHNHLRKGAAKELIAKGSARFVGQKNRALTALRLGTDRGYDAAVELHDDLVFAQAPSGGYQALQLLHGGTKQR